ncbi:MAG: hypothetical protein RIQ89_1376, partial [Bacteroidota bacterium]
MRLKIILFLFTTTCISGTSYCGSLVDSALTQTYQLAIQVVDSCNCGVSLGCYPSNYNQQLDTILVNSRSTELSGMIANFANNIIIDGVFEVDSSFTFLNCGNIVMEADAKVVVKAPDTLWIVSSHIYACDTMWQGIEVEAGAALIITDGSTIEDAITAVKSGGGSHIIISSSELKNNYLGVKLFEGNFGSSKIYASLFTTPSSVL